jgi:hypothetical protein
MHDIEGEGQPDKFGSVPQAACWAMQRKPSPSDELF